MLRVLLADDEAPARHRLRKLLAPRIEEGSLQIVGEASDGLEALDLLRTLDVDLILLDIQMPEMSGFDVLEQLEPDRRPTVVFATAYDAYAIRAFEANAVDYLLKPISEQRLFEAISRAEHLKRHRDERASDAGRMSGLLEWLRTRMPETTPAAAPRPLRQLSIPMHDRILVLPVARLISAEVTEGITRLMVLDDAPGAGKPKLRQHAVSYSLEQLESNLDPEHFVRVHRSALVQVDHITEMIPWFSGRYKLILTGGHEIIASRERVRLLKDRLML